MTQRKLSFSSAAFRVTHEKTSKSKRRRATLDDGCSAELVKGAQFDGELEIPIIPRPMEFIIPKKLLNFSERNQSKASYIETLITYEHDINLSELLIRPDELVSDLKRFKGGMTSPDCSLYWDMPLAAQIINTYRNRAIGYYLQKNGIYVIPNVRWGDQRTYTTNVLPDKLAFLGVEKHSIVSIGSYGCIQNAEKRYHFKAGLTAMLETLEPEIVIVYGPMPDIVFAEFKGYTKFIHFENLTKVAHRREEPSDE